ncbi:MAG: hypothetical protein SFY81_00365 [Verrucomicrobiota bacterium]|nr:hypothetical protein [Verrucomicrobiota bacterium]
MKALSWVVFLTVLLSHSWASSFEVLNPRPENIPLTGVVFGNDRFVAVGHSISVVSTNGTDWEQFSVPELLGDPRLNPGEALLAEPGIVYGDGLFVAYGVRGSLLTSTNGESWVPVQSGTTNNLLSGVYAEGRFVLGTSIGTALVSSNGVDWMEVSMGIEGIIGLRNPQLPMLTYGNGRFVGAVVGGTMDIFGMAHCVIVYSNDGINWEWHYPAPPAESHFGGFWIVALSFDGETFMFEGFASKVFPGKLIAPFHAEYSSVDGQNWTRVTIPQPSPVSPQSLSPFTDNVHFENSTLYLSRYDAPLPFLIRRSTNDMELVGDTTFNFHGLTVGMGKVIAVGTDGVIGSSTNLTNWTIIQRVEPYYRNFYSIAASTNGTIVVGGEAGLAYSTNGQTFTGVVHTNLNTPFRYYAVRGLAFGDGKFVGVGGTGPAMFSTNGIDWDVVSHPLASAFLYDIIHAKSSFYGVGYSGVILTSTEGDDEWNQQVSGTTRNLHGITEAFGKLIAVGYQGAVYSSDGVTWSNSTTPLVTGTLLDVTSGANVAVAVGEYGKILFSTNGIAWSSTFSGTTNHLRTVVFSIDRFHVFGDAGVHLTSFDGRRWNADVLPVSDYPIFAAVSVGTNIVVAGDNAYIFKLGQGEDPGLRFFGESAGNGEVAFTVFVEPSQNYILEKSTNLVDWIVVRPVSSTTGTISITEPMTLDSEEAYYRLQQQ